MKTSPLRFIVGIYARWPALALAIALVTVVGHASTALQPALIGRLAAAASSGTGVVPALVLCLASTWTIWGCWRAFGALDTVLGARAALAFQTGAAERTLAQSSEFFGDEFTGAIVKRHAQMSGVVQQATRSALYEVAGIVIKSAVVGASMAVRDLRLGAAFLVWLACVGVGTAVFLRKIRPLRKAAVALETAAASELADAVGNAPSVTQFGTHAREAGRVAASAKAATLARRRLNRWQTVFVGWLSFVGCANMSALVAWAALSGRGAGDVTFAALLGGIMLEMTFSSRTFQQVQEMASQASEYLAMADKPVSVEDAPGAPALRPDAGSAELRNVTFGYAGKKPVLEGFSLVLRPGEKVALVGASGAGKSTITRLLLRLWDAQGGAVLVDGQDVRRVTRASLRAAVAYVPQDPSLFHRSLADNIAYGRPDATREEIERAAKIAHCHEFIGSLPLGYGTLVGERGVKLSGGERQRVAIARAILKDAKILVLDEPTSALDSESESYIQDGLARAMEGRTTLVVAHRLSTVMRADRIIVMEHGKIVEEGSHAQLATVPGGRYARLWQLQSGGYLPQEADEGKSA